jgi:hypothetical protein
VDDVLFPVFDFEGRSVGLTSEGGKVICFFTNQLMAQRWLWDMGLEGYIVGRGFEPAEIADFCEEALQDGWSFAIINPPLRFVGPVQMGTLENLIDQAWEKEWDKK